MQIHYHSPPTKAPTISTIAPTAVPSFAPTTHPTPLLTPSPTLVPTIITPSSQIRQISQHNPKIVVSSAQKPATKGLPETKHIIEVVGADLVLNFGRQFVHVFRHLSLETRPLFQHLQQWNVLENMHAKRK